MQMAAVYFRDRDDACAWARGVPDSMDMLPSRLAKDGGADIPPCQHGAGDECLLECQLPTAGRPVLALEANRLMASGFTPNRCRNLLLPCDSGALRWHGEHARAGATGR